MSKDTVKESWLSRVRHKSCALCTALAVIGAACSTKVDGPDLGIAGTGATGPASGGASGASSAGGATSSGGAGLGGSGFGAGPSLTGGTGNEPTNGLDQDAACAATKLRAESIHMEVTVTKEINCVAESQGPLALYIVLDNSTSMNEGTKWRDAVEAISNFVQMPGDSVGAWTCTDQDGLPAALPPDLPVLTPGATSAAIQYFHPPGAGLVDECDGVTHGTPAVAMEALPGNAQNIIDSLATTPRGTGTPTVGALRGGTAYCGTYQTAHPGEQCVVILVTDGQPNGCGLALGGGLFGDVDPNAAALLTPIAGDAFSSPNSVTTFTVGMNGVSAAGFALLDGIAVAGGSDCTPNVPGSETCNVSTTGAQGFLEALNTIRDSVTVSDTSTETFTMTVTESTALPCEWEIPSPSGDQMFDKDLVNVQLTLDGMPQQLGKVIDASQCAAVGGGWYYDIDAAPTRLVACPQTCSVLESQADASVAVLFGCVTEVAGPR